MVLGSNPDVEKFFRTSLARSSGQTHVLCDGYKVFPGVKWRGPNVYYSPSNITEIKEIVDLYLSTP